MLSSAAQQPSVGQLCDRNALAPTILNERRRGKKQKNLQFKHPSNTLHLLLQRRVQLLGHPDLTISEELTTEWMALLEYEVTLHESQESG